MDFEIGILKWKFKVWYCNKYEFLFVGTRLKYFSSMILLSRMWNFSLQPNLHILVTGWNCLPLSMIFHLRGGSFNLSCQIQKMLPDVWRKIFHVVLLLFWTLWQLIYYQQLVAEPLNSDIRIFFTSLTVITYDTNVCVGIIKIVQVYLMIDKKYLYKLLTLMFSMYDFIL